MKRISYILSQGSHSYLGSKLGHGTVCIPHMSTYSDCTEERLCSGCHRCDCNDLGQWECELVQNCSPMVDSGEVQDSTLENALQELEREFGSQKSVIKKTKSNKSILNKMKNADTIANEEQVLSYVRRRRALKDRPKSERRQLDQGKIKFYNSVDEINEDTLKNSNLSGVIEAKKLPLLKSPQNSHKTVGIMGNLNESNLQIKENQKFDPESAVNEIKNQPNNSLAVEKVKPLVKNRLQSEVNKNISKIVVQELKSGSEIIGDQNAPVISNITYKPKDSNDTLTAMAFIAGNLLNKLWSMEKDSKESSMEIDMLKKQKIADMLDLFKDPLNIKQENFLKKALEKLSEAIVNQKDNVSVCSDIDLKSLNDGSDNPVNSLLYDAVPPSTSEKNPEKIVIPSSGTAVHDPEVVSKLKEVVDLIGKYKEVSRHLQNLKDQINTTKLRSQSDSDVDEKLEEEINEDENESLNTFAKILEKVTNLLIPDKQASKYIIDNLKSHNILKDSNLFMNEIKDLYKINVKNLTVGSKDKLLSDYLARVQSSPKCIFGSKSNYQPPKLDGNLSKLSGFLKIKSLKDLIEVLGTKETSQLSSQKHSKKVSKYNSRRNNVENVVPNDTVVQKPKSDGDLTLIKEKLKLHLKSIVQDLIDIKNAKGVPAKEEDIKLTDLLPCVYGLLSDNSNKKILRRSKVKPVENIKIMINALKNSTKANQNGRRTLVNSNNRPLSSIVLERVVKNLDKTLKKKSRRSMGQKKAESKSFKDLQQMIDYIQKSNSDPLKKQAINGATKPSDRIILLKALIVDIEQYRNILKQIKNMLDNKNFITEKEHKILQKFLEHSSHSIYYSGSVIRHLENKDGGRNTNLNKKGLNNKDVSIEDLQQKLKDAANIDSNIRISRDDLINRLLRNKMESYIRSREKVPLDYDDGSVGIAKEILRQLEHNNYGLARDLYKQFITRTPPVATHDLIQTLDPQYRFTVANREPSSSIDFTKLGDINNLQNGDLVTSDFLLKQLIDIKNGVKS